MRKGLITVVQHRAVTGRPNNATVLTMKAFTADDLHRKASEIREAISGEPQAVLTASGEPIALLIPVDRTTLDETACAVRQARAQLALKTIRNSSRRTGRDTMTIARIDRVVAATRKAKRRRKALQENRGS